jgi:hypothetical protein
MGRLRGGYLGGSTIIHLGQKAPREDEGPPAALERARIENQRRQSEAVEHEQVCRAAEDRIHTVRLAIRKLAELAAETRAAYGTEEELLIQQFDGELRACHSFVSSFLANEFETIVTLGPKLARLAAPIRTDAFYMGLAMEADLDLRPWYMTDLSENRLVEKRRKLDASRSR